MKHPFSSVIIPAAGSGSRMESQKNKQFLELSGKAVIIHTLLAFEKCDYVDEIIIVTKQSEIELFKELILTYSLKKTIKYVVGGKTRQASVYQGIMAVNEESKFVAVHDGARPFIKATDLSRLFETAYELKSVAAGVPSKDTIKRVGPNNEVIETLNRNELWNIQTPQIFERLLIEAAYKFAERENYQGTDDSSLVEYMGESVYIVMGNYENIKITTAEDIKMGELILG